MPFQRNLSFAKTPLMQTNLIFDNSDFFETCCVYQAISVTYDAVKEFKNLQCFLYIAKIVSLVQIKTLSDWKFGAL